MWPLPHAIPTFKLCAREPSICACLAHWHWQFRFSSSAPKLASAVSGICIIVRGPANTVQYLMLPRKLHFLGSINTVRTKLLFHRSPRDGTTSDLGTGFGI